MQRRGAVQQDRVVLDDFLENVPDLGPDALDDALGALDVVGEALLDELAHDERLEQLERHLLGQAALVELEIRADDDDGAARVVHSLAEQVLAEPALLALEHVGQALEAVVAGPRDRPAAAAVVDQGVARLLEHPLLVADDDLGRAELEEPLEAVVPVDHAPVEVVEVRRREAAAVELHHGAQVGRDDRSTERIIHSGRLPERRNASIRRRRLIAFLRRWPELVRTSAWRPRLSSSRSIRTMMSRTASAPMPAQKIRPRLGAGAVLLVELAELHLADRDERLEGLDLGASLAQLLLLAGSLLLGSARARPGAPRPSRPGGPGSSARAALLVRLALLDLRRQALGLGGRDLRKPRRGVLAALVAGRDDDLAGQARTRSSPRRPRAERVEALLGRLWPSAATASVSRVRAAPRARPCVVARQARARRTGGGCPPSAGPRAPRRARRPRRRDPRTAHREPSGRAGARPRRRG